MSENFTEGFRQYQLLATLIMKEHSLHRVISGIYHVSINLSTDFMKLHIGDLPIYV
jgi:hypothetical protein